VRGRGFDAEQFEDESQWPSNFPMIGFSILVEDRNFTVRIGSACWRESFSSLSLLAAS
jgi:hypothetical protein